MARRRLSPGGGGRLDGELDGPANLDAVPRHPHLPSPDPYLTLLGRPETGRVHPRRRCAPGRLVALRAPAWLLVVALCCWGAGCASARLRREVITSLRDADAQAARGCHAYLLDALALYERLQPRDAATRAIVSRRIFRTSLLLALRERELGLDAGRHFERARAQAPEASDADRERLELAALVPANPAGVPRERQMHEGRAFVAARDRLAARVMRRRGASDDPELDAYLDLAIACTGRVPLDAALTPASLLPEGEPTPLLLYRLGACRLDDEPRLNAALAREPRFTEAFLFVGRNRLAGPADAAGTRGVPRPALPAARAAFAQAHAAFPDSPAITMELAAVTRAMSYRDALPLYAAVAERVPDHQDAWLGKGLCETFLGRHREAIASLTRLLDLGQWLASDGYYWRAWNRHQLKDLDAAWDDVERAKKLSINTDVYALAGVIAFDRQQLDVAQSNLEQALALSARNCTAAWYLGLTHASRETWPSSAEAFGAASTCYRADAEAAQADLEQADMLEPSDPSKTARVEAARAAIAQSLSQEALSAYNTAFGFVKAERVERARPFLELAGRHADVKARADELLAYLDRR